MIPKQLRLILAFATVMPFPAAGLSGSTPIQASGAETYRTARIDTNGDLRIVRSDNQAIVVKRRGEQTSFSSILISDNGRAVGATALFKNCCTSYDIPLQLMVYAEGKEHWLKGSGLMISQWGFLESGSRVAFGEETVHFACSIRYELRDIKTERLVERAEIPEPCGQIPNPPPVKIPDWVASIRSR